MNHADTWILGAGVSGHAAAALLEASGESYCLLSESSEARNELPPGVPKLGILSPGFPAEHPWISELRARGLELLPEFEWGARHLQGPILAVTGSLGKTSMAHLAKELAEAAGLRCSLSGNSHRPVSDLALKTPEAELHVLELSSFQLEQLQHFRPKAALCLNLKANHLDRHGNLESYAQAKAKLCSNQEDGDLCLWPEDYPVKVSGQAERVQLDPTRLPQGLQGPLAQSPLRENVLMLLSIMAPLEALPSLERCRDILEAFQFPPHRQQRLDIAGAGLVMDDSKSSCLAASLAAVAALPDPLHLILGGKGKGEALEEVGQCLRKRELKLYLFGEEAERMEAAWKPMGIPLERHPSLEPLMASLWAQRSGEEPLCFSPGCASFDQFPGFEVRGQIFQGLVRDWAARKPLNVI